MGAFLKLAGLGTAGGGGTLLTLWLLAGGHVALAGLTLFVTGALVVGGIALLARATTRSEWT